MYYSSQVSQAARLKAYVSDLCLWARDAAEARQQPPGLLQPFPAHCLSESYLERAGLLALPPSTAGGAALFPSGPATSASAASSEAAASPRARPATGPLPAAAAGVEREWKQRQLAESSEAKWQLEAEADEAAKQKEREHKQKQEQQEREQREQQQVESKDEKQEGVRQPQAEGAGGEPADAAIQGRAPGQAAAGSAAGDDGGAVAAARLAAVPARVQTDAASNLLPADAYWHTS